MTKAWQSRPQGLQPSSSTFRYFPAVFAGLCFPVTPERKKLHRSGTVLELRFFLDLLIFPAPWVSLDFGCCLISGCFTCVRCAGLEGGTHFMLLEMLRSYTGRGAVSAQRSALTKQNKERYTPCFRRPRTCCWFAQALACRIPWMVSPP